MGRYYSLCTSLFPPPLTKQDKIKTNDIINSNNSFSYICRNKEIEMRMRGNEQVYGTFEPMMDKYYINCKKQR